MRRSYFLLLFFVFIGSVLYPPLVYADAELHQAEITKPGELNWSYLYDGGAIPFVWAPLLMDRAISLWVDPRDSPLLFDTKEGGAPSRKHEEVPGWHVSLGAAMLNAYIAVADNHESRWFHVKGMAQSLLTSTFLTGLGKVTFGRHRPDYDPEASGRGPRQSFPSGHSTTAVAGTVYFGLYMYFHGFDRWREPGTRTWWEIATYAGLGALAVYVPYSRVLHNRHHPSDVLAGSLIGLSTSAIFYYWQERRYRDAVLRSGRSYERLVKRPVILPDIENRGVSLGFLF